MSVTLQEIRDFLRDYDGEEMNIMEVCGSHTAAISKNGIPDMLSPKIRLLSGPGCPVCVTPSSYIDRLLDLSKENVIVTFGDLLRVPGSTAFHLSAAKGQGADVRMVYSPMDILAFAKAEPMKNFIFAAVGFETTTPIYALLIEELSKQGIENVRLLTALKTMPEVIEHLCANKAPIDAFIAPGHVAAVTGWECFEGIAQKYQIPFGVAGFSGKELLAALYGIVRARGEGRVMNFYPSVVSKEGNRTAQEMVNRYFTRADVAWRGMGMVKASGRVLREEYLRYDAGSFALNEDHKANKACCCDRVLMGKQKPTECPLFGKVCTPMTPQGACMVSTEGSCFTWLSNHRTS